MVTICDRATEGKDSELISSIQRLFASRAWSIVRQAYPQGSDVDLLGELVRWESLRVAVMQSRVVCCADEF